MIEIVRLFLQRCEVVVSREIVIVENTRLVRLLYLTANFRVKTNAKLMPIFKLREKSKMVFKAV